MVAWYGDADAGYRYSGLRHDPLAWTPLLRDIRERLQNETGQRFNGVLLNLYRDGRDAMGWHSDDEPELGDCPTVASLSLGAERRFDLRRKGSGRIQHSLVLAHGSLLVMRGTTQHHWQHQIARTNRCCSRASTDLPPDRDEAEQMSSDEKLIDFCAERAKRIHDLNDKRLEEMRKTFEQVLPLGKAKKKGKRSPKKR